MDVNGVFNDVYEKVVAYYKNKKTMIKSEVSKKDNKFKEFWIERTVDNHYFANLRVSVAQNELVVKSLASPLSISQFSIEAFEWLTYSDEKKQWYLTYMLEQHEKLRLNYYTFLYQEFRQRLVNSHKDITKYDIMAFFASISILAYVADYVSGTGFDSPFFVYLDTQPKPVKMKVVFSEEDKDLVITTSTGKVSKAPKGAHLQDVLYRILGGNESLDKEISNLFKGVAK